MIELDNFPVGSDAEVSEVYQRCVLISGKCSSDAANKNDEGYVVVQTNDTANQTQFPEQRWPTCRGHFKALVLLSPGVNKIILTSEQDVSDRVEVCPSPLNRNLYRLTSSSLPSDTPLCSKHHLSTWQS